MTNNKRTFLYIMLLLLACISATGYFTVIRSWDSQMCESKIAQELALTKGESVYTYLREYLVVGMTRSDALGVIKKIGQYKISSYQKISGEVSTDVITMKICWHPMNNIKFYLHYDSNGLLMDFNFDPQF